MRTRARDQSGGTLDRIRGRVKEASGALRGDERRKARGKARQVKGETRKRKGHLKGLFR